MLARRLELSARKAQLLADIASRREIMAQAASDALRPLRPINEVCRLWYAIPPGKRQVLRNSIPRLLGAIWAPAAWSRRIALGLALWRLFQAGRRQARRRADAV